MMENKFVEEIKQQPAALKATLKYYTTGEGKNKLDELCHLWRSGKYDKFVFTGMGSSYFISYAAACLFNKYGIESFSVNASELLHYQFSLLKDRRCLFVCISQSGESYEIVTLLRKLSPDMDILSICNEADSYLARNTRICFLTEAGKEEMTSTKTYISSYLGIYIMSLALIGHFDTDEVTGIQRVIATVESILGEYPAQWLSDSIAQLEGASYIQLVGRGPVYATVKQSALMFMEATATPASGLFGGEFRHGPMEMVKEGFKAIILAPLGETYEQSITMAEDIVKYGGKVVLITNGAGLSFRNVLNIVIPCDVDDLFAIAGIIPLQLIVNQWALKKSMIPGSFSRGAKVTTIE